MASGLKVNLSKSMIVGINLEKDLIAAMSFFLDYSVGSLPFMFLGVEVGINPRKTTASTKIIRKITNRFAL